MAARKRKSPRARKSSQKASASAAASKRQRISSSDAVDPQPIIEQEPRKQSITPSGVPDAADEANDCPNKEITTETVVEVAVQNDPFSRPPWETVDHDDRETKLRWMSPIEPIDDHKRVIQERLPKSGRWILEDLRFNTWKDGNESAILWIYGAVGVGKTILVSRILDHIREFEKDSRIAYFYCNRTRQGHVDIRDVLRSLAQQLSTRPKRHILHNALIRFYERRHRRRGADVPLSLEDIEDLLGQVLDNDSRTYLIVDEIDDMCERDQWDLFSIFKELTSKFSTLKNLLSSQPNAAIRRELRRELKIGVDEIENEDDIRQLIRSRLERRNTHDAHQFVGGELVRACKALSKEAEKNIEETLIDQGRGRFLWVALQLRSLLALEFEHKILEGLRLMSIDLFETYEEIYQKLKSQDPLRSVLARRALHWRLATKANLEGSILVQAASQDPDEQASVVADMALPQLISSCLGLLIIDPCGTVQFCHPTVYDFLMRRPNTRADAFDTVALVCLRLLLDRPNWYVIDQSLYRHSPNGVLDSELASLVEHARQHWPFYCLKAFDSPPPADDVERLLQRFLGSEEQTSEAYQKWLELITARDGFDKDLKQLKPETSSVLPLALFGFKKILNSRLSDGMFDHYTVNEKGYSWLGVAVAGGHRSMVDDLLHRRVVVVDPRLKYADDTALISAIRKDDVDMVKMLLSHNANVNAATPKWGALNLAANRGSMAIAKILIDRGADVNAEVPGKFGSALIAALTPKTMEFANEAMVNFLLDCGAKSNAKLIHGAYGSALAAAAHAEAFPIVERLLEGGADANETFVHKEYASVLVAAINRRNVAIITLLIEHGANPNQNTIGDFEKPLGFAMLSKDEQVIKLLIDHGADVNAVLTSGLPTFLARAVSSGQPNLVNLLIANGADINATAHGNAVDLVSIAKKLRGSTKQQMLQILRDSSTLRTSSRARLPNPRFGYDH